MEEKTEIKTEEKVETKTNEFEIIEVPTQMGLAFRDNSNESILDQNQLLLGIANDLRKLKKSLVGN